ncbi:MAG: type II CRISPR-associated endonuclease Cas1 [Rhodospirillaceae bacterium]|nr:type II CRISPR-associated endonuclease Cas1 [Rhodospirillaceae bacterium]
MIGRIVEIAEDDRHLAVERGFMTVRSGGREIGRVPLDDVGAVIANAHGLTYSNNLVVALAERGASLVVCGRNHRPVAWLWPVVGHHAQGTRMRAQKEAPRPLEKRLWQQIVKAKIAQQASVLSALGRPTAPIALLQHRVGSGDPENMEAQAARRYWPLMFGDDFRRDRDDGGINALLNYGYTVLRAAAARAICGAGLHPAIGISHRSEDLALADDLMEPFRPMVDLVTAWLVADGVTEVTKEAKRELALVTAMDMRTERGVTPLATCLERLAVSLAQSFETGRAALQLPFAPVPLELPRRAMPEQEHGESAPEP